MANCFSYRVSRLSHATLVNLCGNPATGPCFIRRLVTTASPYYWNIQHKNVLQVIKSFSCMEINACWKLHSMSYLS